MGSVGTKFADQARDDDPTDRYENVEWSMDNSFSPRGSVLNLAHRPLIVVFAPQKLEAGEGGGV